MRSTIATLAAATMAVGLLVAAGPPAQAANDSVSLTGVQSSGLVGVPQNLTVTTSLDGAPCGSTLPTPPTILLTTSGPAQPIGTATFSSCVGSASQFTFQWIPSGVMNVWVSAQAGSVTSNASRTTISAVSTTTRVTAASVVTQGQPTTITASVTANSGSQSSPQGSIQFSIQGGGNIGGPVALNSAVPSTAQIQWTPAVLGTSNIIATYIPATVQGVTTWTCRNSCASDPDPVQVTSTGVKMYLADPPSFSVGTAATLTAVVSVVPPSGTVTFTVNGQVIASNVPVQAGGTAQARWVPPAAGSYTIGAAWRGAGNLSASAQEVVTVGTAPAQSDVITLAPQGQAPWSPGGVYSLGNGTTLTFDTHTASGAPVTLAAPGPCAITGATLTVTQGNGQCRLTATSPGGNGYGPASASYTISMVPGQQTLTRPLPSASRLARNRTITLATRAQNRTTVGQPLTWRVTSSTRICQLRYPANGSVQLRTLRNGTCTIRVQAAAVPQQWARLQINRSYRIN